MPRDPKLTNAVLTDVLAGLEAGTTTKSGAARELGVSRNALRNALDRFERETTEVAEPGVEKHDDGGATVTSGPMVGTVTLTEKDLLEAFDYDPDEVVVVRRRINAWGSEADPHFQLRIDVIPKDSIFTVPEDREWMDPPQFIDLEPGAAMHWAYLGDHHFPYIDHGLMQTSTQFLRDRQFELVVLGGDLLNNGAWARHRGRPRFVEESKLGVKQAGGYVRAIRKALPDARIVWIPGNHDQWIEQRLIEDNSAALGFRGYSDDYDVLDIRRLVDIDPAHVEFVDMDWDLAFHSITDKLTAFHGPPGGKGGKNALDSIFDKLTGSGIFGHTHRGGMRYKTRHDPATGKTESHVAIEAFMMARHHKGMGYAGQPDWTQGFVYGAAWPDDGNFTAAPAYYNDVNNGGTLLLPDGARYKSTVDKFGEEI